MILLDQFQEAKKSYKCDRTRYSYDMTKLNFDPAAGLEFFMSQFCCNFHREQDF